MSKIIKINSVFDYTEMNLYKNNLNQEKYEEIKLACLKETDKYYVKIRNHEGFRTWYKKCLEVLKYIETYNDDVYTKNRDNFLFNSPVHRRKLKLENNLQKQIFINNFMFTDNDKFIHALKMNNINKDDIENLIELINHQKIISKKTKQYDLDIEKIINIDGLCTYYNLNMPTLFINKILELYYLEPELLSIKVYKKI